MTVSLPMPQSNVKRVEDPRFIVGRGGFLPNRHLEGELHLAAVRSPVPHGRILSIDTAEALAVDGVEGVYVADDLNLGAIPCKVESIPRDFARPPLARDVVRFAGEIVAVVVARSAAAAVDGAELVWADIEPFDAVASIEAALADDAPLVFPDAGTNVLFQSEREPIDDLFADADVVVKSVLKNQRLAPVPLETNGALGAPDGSGVEVWLGSQNVFGHRREIADSMGMEHDDLRARVPDMGGAFGGKYSTYPEQVLATAIAHKLQRPVRWYETRRENLALMYHGRDQVQHVEIGSTSDGTLIGLRVTVYQNVGAYPAYAAETAGGTTRMACGAYRIPRAEVGYSLVATNTTPVDAYRGAGRPEATALIERSMDLLAAELGMDPIELRRRNLIAPEDFPYETPTGPTYDSGDFVPALDRAMEMADYDGLREEQARRRAAGDRRQLGIGVCTYVEVTSWAYDSEWSSIEIDAAGAVTAKVGTSNHGQGHDTAYTQILAEALKVPLDNVTIVQGDTREIASGTGTVASRSLQVAGNALVKSADAIIEQAKTLVADKYEAAADDVVLTQNGMLSVAGVPDTAISWGAVAVLALAAATDADSPAGLYAEESFQQLGPSATSGTHIAVLEVDTETGETKALRHIAVDDCGVILNPMIVHGQVHGGVAQAYGQALLEEVIHDEDANLLTGSLVSYLIPTAGMIPSFELDYVETPAPLNPIGVKGIGEAGAIAGTPAVQNAVVDALSHLGVRHIDMPTTPGRIWHAITDAAQAST